MLAIPVERDQLLSGLVEGQGDVAVGNLTVTVQREAEVDFVVLPGHQVEAYFRGPLVESSRVTSAP